jgi:hypothetical protein
MKNKARTLDLLPEPIVNHGGDFPPDPALQPLHNLARVMLALHHSGLEDAACQG